MDGISQYYPEIIDEEADDKLNKKKMDILKKYYSSNLTRISS